MVIQDLAIKVLVVAMMLAIGLDLSLADLRAGLRQRRALLLALAANLVVFPLVAVGVTQLLSLAPGIAVGLLVCAVAPGGPTGPLFTRIARADLGFATSLQVSLCFVALLSAPASLQLAHPAGLVGQGGLAKSGGLLWPMTRTLAVYQILPLCTGMVLRKRRESLAARLSKPMGVLANVLLLAVIVGLLATRGHILLEQGAELHLVAVALVLAPIALASLSSDRSSTATAAGFVTTVRNLSIALLLSSTFFDDPAVDAAILVWGFYMMMLPAGVAVVFGRQRARSELDRAHDGAHGGAHGGQRKAGC